MERRYFLKSVAAVLALISWPISAKSKRVLMEPKIFWSIVGSVKVTAGANPDARPKALEQKLITLPAVSIQAFQNTYESLLLKANRWDLWGAAYLMNGGCSDDGFKYFRDWLISEGQIIYEAAIQNPESLATFPKREFFELELYGYSASKAFQRVGAGELERSFDVELATPSGTEWGEDDLPKMFPKLAAKYL